MFLSDIRYIAAGVLTISRDESDLSSDTWSRPELQTWNMFVDQDGPLPEFAYRESYVLPDAQASLLGSQVLLHHARLYRAGWIKLVLRLIGQTHCAVRVYILPDDVGHKWVQRSDAALRKSRQAVLSTLDYSQEAWEMGISSTPRRGFVLLDDLEDVEDPSLLQLFNTIPSPFPDPEVVHDSIPRDAMYSLLESKVPGLTTELYPYQRRSAALMLQKEVQPGKALDPRLRHVQDQEGNGYYYDSVAGTLILEPRYYDDVPGGILAEEMGSGKTIICLALITASRGVSTKIPAFYETPHKPIRKSIGSLVDMAASCAMRHAVSWRPYFESYGNQDLEFKNCIKAMEQHPGHYFIPASEPPLRAKLRRSKRPFQTPMPSIKKVFLSSASIVVVPNNLVVQWQQEIQKHTEKLKLLVIDKKDEIPFIGSLLNLDIVLFPQSRFEMLATLSDVTGMQALRQVHFKRCIVDEGHKLGNSKLGKKSNLLTAIEQLRFDYRWVVTGTPSHGLFGVDNSNGTADPEDVEASTEDPFDAPDGEGDACQSSNEMEKKDIERIGSMATLFLKARPWANTASEMGDTPADWDTYLMLPKHKKGSYGRWDSLQTTLNSLIVRHRLKEVGNMLPPVTEKIVMLDGSYQDRLSMNIFSMMIIFNSVQSQRTDMDYFFHPKQRRSLLQIVHNLKQSSFFGGSFFASAEISKAVKTAEEFLQEKKVAISTEDEALLGEAIRLGHLAVGNSLRNLSNQFHEMPVCVENFPGGAGQSWSLSGGEESSSDTTCTSASLLLALQRLVYNTAGEPEKFNALLNGGFAQEGMSERQKLLSSTSPDSSSVPREKQSQTLAGNTKLGGDNAHKARSHGVNGIKPMKSLGAEMFSGPLEATKVLATVSAKMSYLLDQIVKYQDEEKILVFYENENVAWYLASMLDVVSLKEPEIGYRVTVLTT